MVQSKVAKRVVLKNEHLTANCHSHVIRQTRRLVDQNGLHQLPQNIRRRNCCGVLGDVGGRAGAGRSHHLHYRKPGSGQLLLSLSRKNSSAHQKTNVGHRSVVLFFLYRIFASSLIYLSFRIAKFIIKQM